MSVTTDSPDWQPHVGLATQIANTGAPLLAFKTELDFLVGSSLPAATSTTRPASGQFTIGQTAYEIIIKTSTVSSPAAIISAELQWFDSSSGIQVDDEIYYFYEGNLTTPHNVHGRGPSKSDRLVIVFTNHSATIGCTISYVLLQTSRIYTRELWRTFNPGGAAQVFPGFTAATFDMSSNILSADSFALLHNTTQTIVLPLYTGTVQLWGDTTDATAGNSQWNLFDATDTVAASQQQIVRGANNTAFGPAGISSFYLPTVALPRSQCSLQFSNNNATTTETLRLAMVAQELRS